MQIPWHPKNPPPPCLLEVITDHASKEIDKIQIYKRKGSRLGERMYILVSVKCGNDESYFQTGSAKGKTLSVLYRPNSLFKDSINTQVNKLMSQSRGHCSKARLLSHL